MPLPKYVRFVDALNDRIGRAMYWLTLLMVVIGTYNTLARYLGKYLKVQLTSNALVEFQWYLFSLVFLLGAAYAVRHNAHVRVDVLYERLSVRGKAWLNLAGALLLLVPFSIFLLWTCIPTVLNSWHVLEGSPDPGGLPRYPIKTIMPIAFMLLILQGAAEIIRQVCVLRGDVSAEETEVIHDG